MLIFSFQHHPTNASYSFTYLPPTIDSIVKWQTKKRKPLAEMYSTFNVIPSVFLYDSWKYAMVTLESRGFRVYSIAGYLCWCLSPVSNRRVGLQGRNEECKIAQYLLWVKVKQSRNRSGVAQRVPGALGSQISWHSAHEGGEVVSLTHRPPLPPGMFLVLILLTLGLFSKFVYPNILLNNTVLQSTVTR
jgi:hypothetical protein